MNKQYPEYIYMIDLIIEVYNESNPIIISELIEKEFETEVSIFQICNYLEINKENWLQESNKIEYYEKNY